MLVKNRFCSCSICLLTKRLLVLHCELCKCDECEVRRNGYSSRMKSFPSVYQLDLFDPF